MSTSALPSGDGAPLGLHVEATRRRLSVRQAEVVAHLVEGAEDVVEEVGYSGLTVRNVASRAGVAPATAYTYFSSKDHLLAEVLWRRMEALPPVAGDDDLPVAERIEEAVRAMILFAAQSPALVDACTVALLSPNPDVRHLRDRIGSTIHRRLAAAAGPGTDPRVIRVLETCYSGALLTAGIGHMSFLDIPSFVAGAATLMIGAPDRGTAGAEDGADT